jgi:hypothetical protein
MGRCGGRRQSSFRVVANREKLRDIPQLRTANEDFSPQRCSA